MAANATTSKSTSSLKTKVTKSKENAATNNQKPAKPKESVSNSTDANRLADCVKSEEPEILVVKDPKVSRLIFTFLNRKHYLLISYSAVRKVT